MNKIILESYPVDRLPEDIQQKLVDAKRVRLIVETEDQPAADRTVSLEDIFAARNPPYLSADEIMKEVHDGRYDD